MTNSIIRQYDSSMPVGKISKDDRDKLVNTLGSYLNTLGEDIYHVGYGRITGEGGWKEFNRHLKQSGLNNLKFKAIGN